MMNQYGLLTIVAIALIAGVSHSRSPQKIVGGLQAVLGEFPYQVSLYRRGILACGGAIISSSHVLTAKHCVEPLVNPRHDLLVASGSIQNGGGQFHRVKALYYYVDDKVAPEAGGHDIAIIELNKTIALNNSTVKIVELTDGSLDIGSTANVTGWGVLNEASEMTSRSLLKLSVTIEGLNKPYKNKIFVRGAPGTGICSGDSGSPLVRNGHLIGIVKNTYGACARGYSDVYTYVYYYKNWIQQVIGRE